MCPGLVIRPALHISRQSLQSVAAGEKSVSDIADDHAFPIILCARSAASGGHGLQKVDNVRPSRPICSRTTRIRFSCPSFVDYSGDDGHGKMRLVPVL